MPLRSTRFREVKLLSAGQYNRSVENILVGTASWTDATLVKSGRFYPADAKTPEQRLRFYASQFPVPRRPVRRIERRRYGRFALTS